MSGEQTQLGLNEQLLLLQRNRQANPIHRTSISNTPIHPILSHNQILAVRVDEQADKIRAHVVAALLH